MIINIIIFYMKISATLVVVALGSLLGTVLLPANALLVSYASEVAYPLDESSISGYMIFISQIYSFVLGLIVTALNN